MEKQLMEIENKLIKMIHRSFKESKLYLIERNRKSFLDCKQHISDFPFYFRSESLFKNGDVDDKIVELYKEYVELKFKYMLNINKNFNFSTFKNYLEDHRLFGYIFYGIRCSHTEMGYKICCFIYQNKK